MYFWKIEKLKEDIKSDNFNEKDKFLYAFIYIAFGVVAMELLSYFPVESPNI